MPIRLSPADAERYARLRLRMLLDAPWAYSASPEDDKGLDLGFLEKSLASKTQAVFAVESARAAACEAPASLGPQAVGAGAAAPHGEHEKRELIAAAGIVRQVSPKFRHRATIWGVFVEPVYRRRGLARAVMAAVIDLARTWEGVDYIDIGVSERADEARRLYESLGFVAWGREPEATGMDGQRYDEVHMTLRLRSPH